MLEQMRESTGSFVIWILFAIIIAAFVLFFGSPSDSLGCGSSNSYALEVDGEEVSENSWRFAYNGMPYVVGNIPGDQRKPLAFEFLLQREILAQAADEMDFKVSDDLVDEAIKYGDFYLLGNKIDGTKVYFKGEFPNSYFEFDYLNNLVKGKLGLPSLTTYKKEQKREMMAYFVKQELLQSASVSDEEAKHNFIANNTTVSAKYVKFDASRFRSALNLSELQIQEYASTHEKELKEEWEQAKPRWESDKARLKARILKIAKEAKPIPAAKEEEATTAEEKKEETEAPPEPTPEPKTDEARIAIDAAREEIVNGADFATVAKEKSSDRSSHLGGLIGWRSAESIGYGTEIVKAAKDLEIGKVSEVIDTDRAYFLILIEERSDKGLSFEQKKLDIAQKLAPDALALDHAKKAAENALARAKLSSLSDIFTEEAPRSPLDLNSLPPEILKQLSPEQLQELMKGAKVPGSESGAIFQDGPTELAQLGEAEDMPNEPKPAAPRRVEDVQPPAEEPEAPSEELAVIDFGVDAPTLQSFSRSTRNKDFIAGVGRSQELVTHLFEKLAIGSLASQIYTLDNDEGFVLVELTDRSEADMEQFKEEAGEIKASLASAKGAQILQNWISERCISLRDAGKIKPNYAMLSTGDNKRLPYTPCEQLSQK